MEGRSFIPGKEWKKETTSMMILKRRFRTCGGKYSKWKEPVSA